MKALVQRRSEGRIIVTNADRVPRMEESLQELTRQILVRGMTLHERVELGSEPWDPDGDSSAIPELMNQLLRSLSADENTSALDKYLRWSGMDAARVRSILGRQEQGGTRGSICPVPQESAHQQTEKGWLGVIERVLVLPGNVRPVPESEAIPFAEILTPFVTYFRDLNESTRGWALLDSSGQASLERHLLHTLSQLAGPSLFLEFKLFLARRRSTLEGLLAEASGASCTEHYRAFTAHLAGPRLGAFLHEYAALARLLGTAAHQLARAAVSFCTHLHADLEAIRERFFPGAALAKVRHVHPCSSRLRDHGKSVLRLTFACGRRLLYKPRDLGVDLAFHSLLAWLNDRNPPLDFASLAVLDRGSHGWVEEALPDSCEDEDGLVCFYRRAGMLLTVAYLLGAHDLGHRSLVAARQHPVLVDAANLLHPAGREDPQYTVIETGVLPGWSRMERACREPFALEDPERVPAPPLRASWSRVNTDAMELAWVPGRSPSPSNLPRHAGRSAGIEKFGNHLVQGFAEGWHFLASQRPALMGAGGPLAAFRGRKVRFTFRPRHAYEKVMARMTFPECLREGIDLGIRVEKLARCYLAGESPPPDWPLLDFERECILRWDVPEVWRSEDSVDLSLPGGRVISGYFRGGGMAGVESRLASLDAAGLEKQLRIIEVASGSVHSPQVLASAFQRASRSIRRGAQTADVCLVHMPLSSLQRPSISLGILKAALAREGLRARAFHANLDFADFVGLGWCERLEGLPPESGAFEWLFGGCAFPGFSPDPVQFLESLWERFSCLQGIPSPQFQEDMLSLRALAGEFTDWLAGEVLSSRPRIVGCSSTFTQQVPSLALLRRLRELDPGVVTMMGGANCETVMGRSTHESFPWVDFVVSGEAEGFFAELCGRILLKGRNLSREELPSGTFAPVHREWGYPALPGTGKLPRAVNADMTSVPIPDYDDYFAELEARPYSFLVRPSILVETSRGCWWGQVQHCTFCGLNGTGMSFRSKRPEQVVEELRILLERHGSWSPGGVSGIQAVDNILDPAYFTTTLPALARSGIDYNIFYEIKANLKKEQVRLLRQAGVRWVQPGIESLHSEILRLLRKGCKAWQNLQLLKWARQFGIPMIWNLLHTFPGDEDRWYEEMAGLFPLLHHLQPGGLSPIRFDRYSPYFDRASDFGLHLRPFEGYRYSYPLPADRLMDQVYFFENAPPAGHGSPEQIRSPGIEALVRETMRWERVWLEERPTLRAWRNGELLELRDTRPCATCDHHQLDPASAGVLIACDDSPPRRALLASLARQGLALPEAERLVEDLLARKLAVELDGRVVSLVLFDPVPDLCLSGGFPSGSLFDCEPSYRTRQLEEKGVSRPVGAGGQQPFK